MDENQNDTKNDIKISIGADTSDLENSLKKVVKSVQYQGKKMKESFEALSAELKNTKNGMNNLPKNNGMDKLNQQLKSLATTAKNVASKIKVSLGKAFNDISKNGASFTQLFSSKMTDSAKGASIARNLSLMKGLGGLLAVAGLGKSVEGAMDSVETANMFMTVFGDRAEEMSAWIKEVNKTMGLAEGNTQAYTATIMQMGKAMGLSTNDAMSMSQTLATMAGDISSFYNVDIAQAQQDLQSALAGSNEVLSKYGVVVREETLKQFAYANGIATVNSELSASQRAMTLVMMTEQQLGQANGDMAKTLTSPSNQLRILKANLNELKVALGKVFLPVVQVILPLANKLITILTTVTNKVADCIADLFGLFGVNISTNNSAGGVISDVIDDVAISSGDIADNIGDAKKDAKEMAKSLASFDKLNVLNSNKSSSSSGSTGSAPTIGSMGGNTSSNTASEASKGVNQWAKQIHDAIVNNPYFKSLKQSFFGLVDACKSFIQSAGGWLKLFMDNGGREFLNNLGDCALIVGDILVTALKDGVTWVTNFLNSAKGQAVIKSLAEMCRWLSEKLKDVLTWIRENKDMLYKIIGVVASVKLGFSAFIKVAQGVSKIKTGVGLEKTAIGKLPTVLKGVKGAWETMQIAGLLALDKIKLAFPNVLSGAKSMLSGAVSAIGGAVSAVAGAIGISSGALVAIIAGVIAVLTLVILNWDKVKEWGIKAWNGIKSAWSASNQWCYNNIVSPMINHFRNMWNTARDLGTRAWDGIKNTWQGMGTWYGSLGQRVSEHFSNMWQSIRNGGQSAWQYLQRVFNSGGSFFRDITSSMGNAFKQVLNMAIKGINNIIGIPFRGINSAIRGLKNISILGARPFQFLRELNVPQIPYLAKGGVVDKATLAMIGEGNQNEAVIPLDTFYNKLSQMFAEQNRMLAQNTQGNATIILQMDGKEVARGTANNMKEMAKLGQLDMTWL